MWISTYHFNETKNVQILKHIGEVLHTRKETESTLRGTEVDDFIGGKSLFEIKPKSEMGSLCHGFKIKKTYLERYN